MKYFKFIFPFLYSFILIIGIHYIFNPTYFQSNLILFTVPTIVFILLSKEIFKKYFKTFIIVTLILIPITIVYEYISLWLDIWNFNQSIHRLIGIKILGAPIEEFMFWFGAGPLVMSLYLYNKSNNNE